MTITTTTTAAAVATATATVTATAAAAKNEVDTLAFPFVNVLYQFMWINEASIW